MIHRWYSVQSFHFSQLCCIKDFALLLKKFPFCFPVVSRTKETGRWQWFLCLSTGWPEWKENGMDRMESPSHALGQSTALGWLFLWKWVSDTGVFNWKTMFCIQKSELSIFNPSQDELTTQTHIQIDFSFWGRLSVIIRFTLYFTISRRNNYPNTHTYGF